MCSGNARSGTHCVRTAFGERTAFGLRSDCVRSRRMRVRARSDTTYARSGAFGYNLSGFATALSARSGRVRAAFGLCSGRVRGRLQIWAPRFGVCFKVCVRVRSEMCVRERGRESAFVCSGRVRCSDRVFAAFGARSGTRVRERAFVHKSTGRDRDPTKVYT